jgi:hypothetical protein
MIAEAESPSKTDIEPTLILRGGPMLDPGEVPQGILQENWGIPLGYSLSIVPNWRFR